MNSEYRSGLAKGQTTGSLCIPVEARFVTGESKGQTDLLEPKTSQNFNIDP